MKATRAVAAEWWRVRELRDLPIPLLNMGSMLVQDGGRWPRVNCLGIVTTIKKGGEGSQEEVSSREVVAADGMETRPVTNTSPWVAAYESIRYDDLEGAREVLMTEDMHGARGGHEIYGVSMDLAMQIEDAQLKGEEVVGFTVDKRKFFDLMDYPLVFAIWEKMGLPAGYIDAIRNFYRDLVTRYKVSGTVSRECKRANGFIQGLSGSIQAALTIMAVWDRMIKERCPGVETGGFIDDTNMRAQGQDALGKVMKAWDETKVFDQMAGMETNMSKTKAYTTVKGKEKDLKRCRKHRKDDQVKLTTEFVLVGSNIHIQGKGKGASRKARVAKTIATMDRIVASGMRMEQKTKMVGTAAVAKATFGTELEPLNSKQKLSIRRKASWVIWGKGRWLRGVTPTMNLIVKGHRVDPRQAQAYHQLTTWRRVLTKSKKLRARAEGIWQMRREQGKVGKEGDGPIAVLERTVSEIGWKWEEFGKMGRRDKCDLPFLTQEDEWWRHEVREDLRNMVWTKDADTLKRRSFKGTEGGVDHMATAELYRETANVKNRQRKAVSKSIEKKKRRRRRTSTRTEETEITNWKRRTGRS